MYETEHGLGSLRVMTALPLLQNIISAGALVERPGPHPPRRTGWSSSLFGRLELRVQHVLLFYSPIRESGSSPIDDGLHLYPRVMNDIHVLPSPSHQVDHLIRPSLECVPGLSARREPEEIPRFDFLLSGLALPVFIEDDTGTFSSFDDIGPFVLVAVPVWDRADVVWRHRVEVNTSLGQATPVTEV